MDAGSIRGAVQVRVLRVARLFRLLKMRSLQTLFRALTLSIPALVRVCRTKAADHASYTFRAL